MANSGSERRGDPEPEVEFDDWLIKLFWALHRFRILQWLILLVIRVREKLDIHKFIKKPPTKEVDEMDNCHFRTLYKRTYFEDNHTDPDFLCSMQLNTNLNYYTLTEAIFATSRLSLHLCPCIIYFIIYYHLSKDNLSPEIVFGISLIFTLLGYGILQYCHCQRSNKEPDVGSNNSRSSKVALIWSDFMKCLCCGGLSYLLVPILRTVTQSIQDTRTVLAVCAIMFGVHLLCNDYGLKAAVVSIPLSMNSSIFSVICLASRLQSDRHCLALMSFGVMSFICYPQWKLSQNVNNNQWTSFGAVALVLFIVTFGGYTVSFGMALFNVTLILAVVVVSPMSYVYYVQYKFNILGPWDEARPELKVNMEEIEKIFEKRKQEKCEEKEENQGLETSNLNNTAEEKKTIKEEEKIAEMEAKGIGLIL